MADCSTVVRLVAWKFDRQMLPGQRPTTYPLNFVERTVTYAVSLMERGFGTAQLGSVIDQLHQVPNFEKLLDSHRVPVDDENENTIDMVHHWMLEYENRHPVFSDISCSGKMVVS